jgi:hypothetical protein
VLGGKPTAVYVAEDVFPKVHRQQGISKSKASGLLWPLSYPFTTKVRVLPSLSNNLLGVIVFHQVKEVNIFAR